MNEAHGAPFRKARGEIDWMRGFWGGREGVRE